MLAHYKALYEKLKQEGITPGFEIDNKQHNRNPHKEFDKCVLTVKKRHKL